MNMIYSMAAVAAWAIYKLVRKWSIIPEQSVQL